MITYHTFRAVLPSCTPFRQLLTPLSSICAWAQVARSLAEAILECRAWPLLAQLLTVCTQGIDRSAAASKAGVAEEAVSDAGVLDVWCDLAGSLIRGFVKVAGAELPHNALHAHEVTDTVRTPPPSSHG